MVIIISTQKTNRCSYKQYGTHLRFSLTEDYPDKIDGKSFTILFYEVVENPKLPNYKKIEVVIEASNIVRAQFACDLIICSMNLLSASFSIDVRDVSVYPLSPNSEEKPLYQCEMRFYQTLYIPMYCKLAAKASFHRSHVNAISKYILSCGIHMTHWVDLDPRNEPNIPSSPFPYDHLSFGYAILIAYSAIEEMKLEVQASNNRPSLKDRKWNPEVKGDLENRLKKAKIDINENITWERRGAKKRLEKRLEQRKIDSTKTKSSWSYGIVRDCEIPIIDAISNVSWLRSKIIAHKVDSDIRFLSVYDVSNAQHLVRRLILESLGFWKKQ